MAQVPHTFQAWDSLRRPIWMFDPVALKGVYANPPALALWGARKLADLLARDFSDLSPAVTARTERLRASTAGGEAVDERWTFYPNGQPTTVEATISTIVLDDGRPVLMFEAAPAEVGGEERRAVEALRHTSTLITLFDGAGQALFVNPAAYAAYDSQTLGFVERFTDRAHGEAVLRRACAGDILAEVTEVSTALGRRHHHVQARRVLDPVSGGVSVLLNETDVTARVEAEQARAAAEQRAAMAEATRAHLTEMSHELRTPLNAVIGFSALLQDADLDPGQQDQAERIHTAGQRLLEVVNAMIETGEAPAETAPSPCPSNASSPQPEPGPGLRVLYVDDNDSNRTLVRAVLEAQGIACVTANDGQEGVEAARLGGWDVILMDIQMPVMDGVAAARAIRALPVPLSDPAILALTANTLPEQLEGYEAAGMNDLIAKPIAIGELVAKVTGWAEALQESRALAA